MFTIAAWRLPALGALTGILYFVASPPYGLWPLAWVAMVPLWIAVGRAPRARDAARAGFAAGFVACFGAYFWIADTAHRFWEVPWAFAILLLAIFATIAELHFTAFALLLWWLRRRLGRAPAALSAAVFVACEVLVPRIFPDKLGHSQIGAGALSFAVALVGTHGLSFLLAWTAFALARFTPRHLADWRDIRPVTRARRAIELVLCVAAALALTGWGVARRSTVERTVPERELDVAIVQPNIGDPEEIAAILGSVTAAIDSTVGAYIAGSQATFAAAGSPDVVVWPETAVPAVPRPRILDRLVSLTDEIDADLIFGSYKTDRRADGSWRFFNAAYHMDATGRVRAEYAKHKLLLFGEYVPLSNRFPQLLEILPSPGEFTPGPGPQVFDVDGVALTPLICYELLFPRVVRAALRQGGTVIVNLTNDYWFGRHSEPYQHLALTRMCALEIGRPIVRATNTGISALIGADGEVRAQTGLWEPAILRGVLPIPPMSWTPYARWGEAALALWVGAACAAVLLAWGIRRDRSDAATAVRAPGRTPPASTSAATGPR